MGFFSGYWYSTKVFVGDGNQLKPVTFGQSLDNHFQKQCQMPYLNRIKASGKITRLLTETRRFQNRQNLKIAALVNDLPDMKPVEGSFHEDNTKISSAINMEAWNIEEPVILVNSEECIADLKFCSQTALAIMKTIIVACMKIDGSRTAIVTPYNGQLCLLTLMMVDTVSTAQFPGQRCPCNTSR